ncbi:hypothetical protein QTP70_033007 [Hemibagrus guttatus]|uniref:Tc1-like transposase DDE domain-containing protein n=1 Tax=Hemibagrus guttatus TaxID=175788 RepID=A0AAE0V392_9TELE|nr:hypothetical protein QTP70_033007 [Hemibagrus guttatus]
MKIKPELSVRWAAQNGIFACTKISNLKVDEVGKWVSVRIVSEFEKRQIVMARPLDQNISKTAALVRCSRSAVVSIYQKCPKEGTVVNRRQGHGRPRLIDAHGERRLARVVRSNRRATVAQTAEGAGSDRKRSEYTVHGWPVWSRATVAQIAEEVNAGSDRKVSEYTVHHNLLRMGLHSRRPVRVPKLTPVHCKSTNNGHVSIRTGPRRNGRRRPGLMNHVAGRVCVHLLPGKHMAPACTMGRRRAGGGSLMLWAMFCWETLGPAIHGDVTLTRSTYLSIVTDHVHPFMETVFPDGCGLFQQDNAPCHKAEMVQEWFDEHTNQFELTWPPNSPDLNPAQHLWDVLDKQVRSMEAPPCNLEDLKDLLLTSWCQIPQHTFRGPCLDGSGLFWHQKGY